MRHEKAASVKFAARPTPVPELALLRAHDVPNGFVDCFYIDIAGTISHAQFVEAFYTSWLFKLERFALQWLVNKPSTDAQARELARGARDQFAAWTVEARAEHQLLLCDYQGATRSWLMVFPLQTDGVTSTRLYFGSAISPARTQRAQAQRGGVFFRSLVGLHTRYSKALLGAACRAWRKVDARN